MPRFGFDNSFDTIALMKAGGQAAGLYLDGAYYKNTMGITFDPSFDILYHSVNVSGDRSPLIGSDVWPVSAYDLGQNDFTLSADGFTKDVIIYLADTFTITTPTSGFSYLPTQTISANISGGDWDINVPSVSARTSWDLENLQGSIEGENLVTYNQLDPNLQSTSADNQIIFIYSATTPILAVSDNENVETSATSVSAIYEDISYLLGGNVLTSGNNERLYTSGGKLLVTGGSTETEPSVLMYPKTNGYFVSNIEDDFSNARNSETRLITKHPLLSYNGLTSIDQETYGTSYTATSALVIDETAPYEERQDLQFFFTSGVYGNYNFDIPYFYEDSDIGSTISIIINYTETGFQQFTDLGAIIVQNGSFANPNEFTDIGAIIAQNGGL